MEGGSRETFFTSLGWPAPSLCLHGPGLEPSPRRPHSWSGSSEPLPLQAVPRAAMAAQGKTPGIWAWSELTSSESRGRGVGLTTGLLLSWSPWPQPPNLSPSATMRVPWKTPTSATVPAPALTIGTGPRRPLPRFPVFPLRATDSRAGQGERNLSGQQFTVQTARGG